jgi:hypothetical protein
MNNYFYRIKVNLLNYIDRKNKKNKKPYYNELTKFENYSISEENHLALGFGAGRTGQSWFSKIFNNHTNWIGSHERFADHEAFFRYATFYKLPIDKGQFYELYRLSAKRDMSLYQNSFISSPYLSFGVKELCEKLKPNYLFFNLRDPVKSIESFHFKGWYDLKEYTNEKGPSFNSKMNLYRSFSRIVPDKDFYNEWTKLTRIGKITWFWATNNKSIKLDFDKLNNFKKYYIKLEDIDQNYDYYQILSNKFNLQKKMNKSRFLATKIKTPNIDFGNYYKFKDWSTKEKKEFENIITEIFPYYDGIKTSFI